MTHLVLMCFGVCVCLCGAVWIISLVKAALKRRAHRAFLSVMNGRNDREKASAQQWFLTVPSSVDVAFARELLLSEDTNTMLDAARMFLRRPEKPDEGALEALVKVARLGSFSQRCDALTELRTVGRACSSIARPLMALLNEEPNAAFRIDMVVVLTEMAKVDGAPLDSSTRMDVVRAVARRLLDPTREVRCVARIALQKGGPLQYLLKECELTLMEILRSSDQDAIDAAASIILDNKAELRAALSCIPASKAHASLLKNVL